MRVEWAPEIFGLPNITPAQKEQVKMLKEIVGGNVKGIEETEEEWEEVEITVDSGAFNNVCGKGLMPQVETKETDASRRKEYFYTASKEKVHNLGKKSSGDATMRKSPLA